MDGTASAFTPGDGSGGTARCPLGRLRRRPKPVAMIIGVAVFAWVASGYASFTWQATACVLLAGAGVIAVGLWHRPPAERRPRRPPRGAVVWMIWIGAFLAWWGSAFITGSRASQPTLSLLLDPVLQAHPLKWVAYLVWLAGGWALVRR